MEKQIKIVKGRVVEEKHRFNWSLFLAFLIALAFVGLVFFLYAAIPTCHPERTEPIKLKKLDWNQIEDLESRGIKVDPSSYPNLPMEDE